MLKMTDNVKTDSEGIMRTATELFRSMGEYRQFMNGNKTHDRAGFSTNKGQGAGKTRRRMARVSRKRNRER